MNHHEYTIESWLESPPDEIMALLISDTTSFLSTVKAMMELIANTPGTRIVIPESNDTLALDDLSVSMLSRIESLRHVLELGATYADAYRQGKTKR